MAIVRCGKKWLAAPALLALLASAAGCAHTAEGLKQDTEQNAPKVAQAMRQAGNAAAKATNKAAKGIEKASDKDAAQSQTHEKPAPPAKGTGTQK